MSSLSEQLKQLATPVSASYSVDGVRRKSLINDDSSRLDTLSCFLNSVSAFEKLCTLDPVLKPFKETLFAETSCRMELCTLMPNEKSQLDREIKRFLCHISPCLRHYEALLSLEWLVHKFQIHAHYTEDYICCVLPYHETGLFPKFLQLLNFNSINEQFRWSAHYAETGQSMSRQDVVRVCRREPMFLPFICSMVQNAVELYQGLSGSRLNDLGNFLLSTVTALCESSLSDSKLANILTSLQPLIHFGLSASTCGPIQSAVCLIVLRFSSKLSLTKELVFSWIRCLLKHVRSGNEFEAARVVNRLLGDQGIATALLPERLASRRIQLLSKLQSAERQLITDEEEAALLDQLDANAVAAQYADKFPDTFLPIDLDVSVFDKSSADFTLAPVMKKRQRLTDAELLRDCESELHMAHALLGAIPISGSSSCIFSDRLPDCTCPKLTTCPASWLSDLLGLVFPQSLSDGSPSSDPATSRSESKFEARRNRRLLHFVSVAVDAYLAVCCSQLVVMSPPKTRASILKASGGDNECESQSSPCQWRSRFTSAQCLLEDGVDQALPLLLACLMHSSACVRTSAYSLLQKLLTGLPTTSERKFDPGQTPHIALLLNTSSPVSSLLPQQLGELLRGDPLQVVGKVVAPRLTRLVLRLLTSQPLPASSTGATSRSRFLCWLHGLRVLDRDSAGQLVSAQPSSDHSVVVGWPAYLHLLGVPQRGSSASLAHLHRLAWSSLLTSDLFSGFSNVAVAAPGSTWRQSVHSRVSPAQAQLLNALLSPLVASVRRSDVVACLTVVEQRLAQLLLDPEHFDYLLIKLESSRTVGGSSSAPKSLFARISEAREQRRLSSKKLKGIATPQPVEEMNATDRATDTAQSDGDQLFQSEGVRLHLLGHLLSQLTESIPRFLSAKAEAPPPDQQQQTSLCIPKTLPPGLRQLFDLFPPLVNHLIRLLSAKQRLDSETGPLAAIVNRAAAARDSSSDSEDDDDLGQEEGQPPLLYMDDLPDPSRDEEQEEETGQRPMDSILKADGVHRLLRICVLRLLVCLTSLLSHVNRVTGGGVGGHRSRRRRRRQLRLTKISTGVGDQLTTASVVTVQSIIDPVFLSLTVYPDHATLHHQVLACFTEVASFAPLILCQRVVHLVQWLAGSRQLMRLDNVQNLSLLGRLIAVAVPSLVQASSEPTRTGLGVLGVFVEGLPGLMQSLDSNNSKGKSRRVVQLRQRRLSFYTGLVRGLAQATGPLVTAGGGTGGTDYSTTLATDRQKKSLALRSSADESQQQQQQLSALRWHNSWLCRWLWTATLFFLNREWQEQAVADQVVPLLMDLHNQFPWDTQVSSWYECFTFLLWLCKSRSLTLPVECDAQQQQLTDGTTSNKARTVESSHTLKRTRTSLLKPDLVDTEISPPSKRAKLALDLSRADNTGPDSGSISQLADIDSCLTQSAVTRPLVESLFSPSPLGQERPGVSTCSQPPDLNESTAWALASRSVRLLASLMEHPDYLEKVTAACSDPSGLGFVYGRLVDKVVQLMIISASSAASQSGDGDNAKTALGGLQDILVKIHNSVPGAIFIRMISDLLDSVHRGLRRKALDLLAAKLSALAVALEPMSILTDNLEPASAPVGTHRRHKTVSRGQAKLEFALETGLVKVTAQLASQYNNDNDSTEDVNWTTGLDRFASTFSRHSIVCLRDLARLLASRYPGEFMRTMDLLSAQPRCWWPVQRSPTTGGPVKGSGAAEARSLACLFYIECLRQLSTGQSLCPAASATANRLTDLLVFGLDHCAASCRLIDSPELTISRCCCRRKPGQSGASDQQLQLTVGTMHSRDQHLQAGLSLLNTLLELAVLHGVSRQTTVTAQPGLQLLNGGKTTDHWFDISSPASRQLLRLTFRLSQMNLAAATGANPERSAVTLRQITGLLEQITRLLMHATEAGDLLRTIQILLSSAVETRDWVLVNGGLSFLLSLSERAAVTLRDQSSGPQALLRQGLLRTNATHPDVIRSVYSTVLLAVSTSHHTRPFASGSCCLTTAHLCLAFYTALLPVESQYRQCAMILEWTTARGSQQSADDDDAVSCLDMPNSILLRLSTFYRVLEELSSKIEAEAFSELAKQLALVDYIVVTFSVMGSTRQKELTKLASRLHLKPLIGRFTGGLTPQAVTCTNSGLACLRRWLLAESQAIGSLDVGSSGDSVLHLPVALVNLLDLVSGAPQGDSHGVYTEQELAPVLDALLAATAGDEALLRPLGSTISSKIRDPAGTWHVRLSAIRMIKHCFDRLFSQDVDGRLSGAASCLVSDTLVALSEAMEDDRPEVQSAANHLFAELERRGLTEPAQQQLQQQPGV